MTPSYPTQPCVISGSTHKNAWDKFCRQCLDRKKFPVSLANHYIRDKTDLFRTWLESSQDWSKLLGGWLFSNFCDPLFEWPEHYQLIPWCLIEVFHWLPILAFSPHLYCWPLRLEVEFQRRAESKATSTRTRSGTKARDIYLRYPKEKAKALIKRLYDRGLWYYDPDFEKDEEDWGEKGSEMGPSSQIQ